MALQWGHGPKTVERTGDESSSFQTRMLQWGHGPKTVERMVAGDEPVQLVAASMGPRPEDRGESRDGRSARRCRSSFNGATARRPWRGGDGPYMIGRLATLQWGHGPKTVERPAAPAQALRPRRASMGPRPEDRGEMLQFRSVVWYDSPLQWGHGPKTVERVRA